MADPAVKAPGDDTWENQWNEQDLPAYEPENATANTMAPQSKTRPQSFSLVFIKVMCLLGAIFGIVSACTPWYYTPTDLRMGVYFFSAERYIGMLYQSDKTGRAKSFNAYFKTWCAAERKLSKQQSSVSGNIKALIIDKAPDVKLGEVFSMKDIMTYDCYNWPACQAHTSMQCKRYRKLRGTSAGWTAITIIGSVLYLVAFCVSNGERGPKTLVERKGAAASTMGALAGGALVTMMGHSMFVFMYGSYLADVRKYSVAAAPTTFAVGLWCAQVSTFMGWGALGIAIVRWLHADKPKTKPKPKVDSDAESDTEIMQDHGYGPGYDATGNPVDADKQGWWDQDQGAMASAQAQSSQYWG